MVNQLFHKTAPKPKSTILDPGCGTGAFVKGIIRWCRDRNLAIPHIVGVESDPRHISEARKNFEQFTTVEIRQQDFLASEPASYDFIIGNPPYVPITELSEEEKARYRALYSTAQGRFDLYLLFFEEALKNLKPGGRLVFITPEKFLYVETAAPLRKLLSQKQVEQIRLVEEKTFGALVTYPTITTVLGCTAQGPTSVILRDGKTIEVTLPSDGGSWLPVIRGKKHIATGFTLEEVCLRVSCGVATGVDSVFVQKTRNLDSELLAFAYPTIAGRQLAATNPTLRSQYSMIVPYSKNGELLSENDLGALKTYLSQPTTRDRLVRRTCVRRKPWYAFHETPYLCEILRPKILCKDITARPQFWIDKSGKLLPRHSVYYMVPKDPGCIEQLCEYLNSETARTWLNSHCQRAANGFIRLQSRILKQLPIPPDLAVIASSSKQESCRRVEVSCSRTKKKPLPDATSLLLEFAR